MVCYIYNISSDYETDLLLMRDGLKCWLMASLVSSVTITGNWEDAHVACKQLGFKK